MRHATHDDLLEIVQMGREFAGVIGHEFDRDVFANTVDALIDADEGVILISPFGMLGGVVAQSYFNREKYAEELWVWVKPDQRGNKFGKGLVKGFEEWAIERGASRVIVQSNQSITPRKTGKIWQGMGYQPEGHLYIKGI